MGDDRTPPDGRETPRRGRETLDAQPILSSFGEIAFVRAGINPVADAETGSAGKLASAERPSSNAPIYLGVRVKFVLAFCASIAWFALTLWIARPWIVDLGTLTGVPLALLTIAAVALVPGFMNAFLIASLLLDRRPPRITPSRYPPVSILIAARNAEASIADTVRSIANQDYPGAFEVFVIDDASDDRTAAIVDACDHPWVQLLRQPNRAGKAAALNLGLAEARHDLIVTIDADAFLYRDALRNVVERYLSDPPNTRAVAGTVLVRNSRRNWVTKAQEWDYFHGIAAVKRVQSLYQGTLVAQGAFSIYERAALQQLCGWSDGVGEDIVLTWAMLRQGFRIGHAEDACCFTNAPETLREFVRQRRHWARGMLRALRAFPGILLTPRLSTLFVWWNLVFPCLDLVFALLFVPGIALALFGIYWIAGPVTLALLPLALATNYLMYRIGSQMFAAAGLRVRRNFSGFVTYASLYSLVLQPAYVAGYVAEIVGWLKRNNRPQNGLSGRYPEC